MFSKNNLLFILITLLSFNVLNASRVYNRIRTEKGSGELCSTKSSCQKRGNKCLCYCSEKGAPREKVPADRPVYVENDPNGIFCYCKQWDLDNYPGPVSRD